MSVSGWHEIRLGDLVEITKGNSYRSVDLGPSATALVTLKSFERGGGYRHDGLKAFTGQYKPEQVVNPGEIVIALTDVTQAAELVGRPAKVPRSLGFKTLVASVDAGIVRPVSDQIDSQFLYYLLLSPQLKDWTYAHTTGTTVLHLNPNAIKAFAASIPPLSEQREIASALSALDDKIELNRRMNATLEDMARALFQSWFVDFDPVHAKAEGRQPAGMDAETAALFPDSFEQSELGQVPRGWNVNPLGQIAVIVDCLHAKKPERANDGHVYLQLDSIREDGLMDVSSPFLIGTKDYELWTSRIEAREGDCVITNVGRVGAAAQIPPGLRAALGRNMTGVRTKPNFPYPTFVIECLKSDAMRNEITLKTDAGTILDALNVKSIPKLRMVLAPTLVLDKFEALARPLRGNMETLLAESLELTKLRDTLLPKLLSGDLRVGDVAA
jgi:type I restriction enzyme S subunit